MPHYLRILVRRLYTIVLFTWSDFKTIFFPVIAFACAAAPLYCASHFVRCSMWIWLHQLMCNVSNQARAKQEDAINKPWRPLPSERIMESDALILRWITTIICVLWSSMYGRDMIAATLGLIITTYLYDDVGMASHYFGKSLCNIGGYMAFEVGATRLMGEVPQLDDVSWSAIILSCTLIFTTIHAQDFSDIEGDAVYGRVTLPIWAPKLSRILTLIGMIAWSVFLCWYWQIGRVIGALFVCLGSWVGIRYFVWRSPKADTTSYVVYNIWLLCAHALPVNRRKGCLAI